MFYYIEPEVAGGLGDGTVIDRSVHPPVVSVLEYRFEGWPGDDLLESYPCFIVIDTTATALRESGLSGASLDNVAITRSSEFDELYPESVLPGFFWLKIDGVAGVSDFGLAQDGRLVISDAARNVLSRFRLDHAQFEAFSHVV